LGGFVFAWGALYYFAMNYRHSFHAGNFADVVKHLALVRILLYLCRKETPFAVIDSHAGRGVYDLTSLEARATSEAETGIARLRGLEGPEALQTYLSLAADPHAYPGSPLIAAKLLRPQDRLVAVEKHPEEAAELKKALAPFRKARVEEDDGYRRLASLLPLPERRGLILIDPPFEVEDEFERAAEVVKEGLARFATGIFLVWYPVKSQAAARRFCGEVLAGAPASVTALTIDATITAAEGKLDRSGLLLLNPPYGFDADMKAMLGLVAPRLPGGKAVVEWLKAEA
jgi:23S rRNA (adenine2030-N6)-methyltransferase